MQASLALGVPNAGVLEQLMVEALKADVQKGAVVSTTLIVCDVVVDSPSHVSAAVQERTTT